ncbi:MAG: hypothetical protein E7399_09040 [Ruminococcaceae bacterium]|nr:hypothetical protein [Oscillospiraceae bacterium]
MIQFIYQSVFNVIKEKPVALWGTSLLCSLLSLLAIAFSGLPIVLLPSGLVLQAAMAVIYVKGYRRETFVSQDLFVGFSKNFLHIAGGMAWMALWLVLWLLVPVIGPIMVIVKGLSYSMTPYILLTQPEVSATDALKVSMQLTKGYKGNMFLTYLVFGVAVWIVCFILAMLSAIEVLSMVFGFILFIVSIILVLFAPAFLGLLQAAFYDEIQKAVAFAKEHPGEIYQPEYLKFQPVYVPYPVEALEAAAKQAAEQVTENATAKVAEEKTDSSEA